MSGGICGTEISRTEHLIMMRHPRNKFIQGFYQDEDFLEIIRKHLRQPDQSKDEFDTFIVELINVMLSKVRRHVMVDFVKLISMYPYLDDVETATGETFITAVLREYCRRPFIFENQILGINDILMEQREIDVKMGDLEILLSRGLKEPSKGRNGETPGDDDYSVEDHHAYLNIDSDDYLELCDIYMKSIGRSVLGSYFTIEWILSNVMHNQVCVMLMEYLIGDLSSQQPVDFGKNVFKNIVKVFDFIQRESGLMPVARLNGRGDIVTSRILDILDILVEYGGKRDTAKLNKALGSRSDVIMSDPKLSKRYKTHSKEVNVLTLLTYMLDRPETINELYQAGYTIPYYDWISEHADRILEFNALSLPMAVVSDPSLGTLHCPTTFISALRKIILAEPKYRFMLDIFKMADVKISNWKQLENIVGFCTKGEDLGKILDLYSEPIDHMLLLLLLRMPRVDTLSVAYDKGLRFDPDTLAPMLNSRNPFDPIIVTMNGSGPDSEKVNVIKFMLDHGLVVKKYSRMNTALEVLLNNSPISGEAYDELFVLLTNNLSAKDSLEILKTGGIENADFSALIDKAMDLINYDIYVLRNMTNGIRMAIIDRILAKGNVDNEKLIKLMAVAVTGENSISRVEKSLTKLMKYVGGGGGSGGDSSKSKESSSTVASSEAVKQTSESQMQPHAQSYLVPLEHAVKQMPKETIGTSQYSGNVPAIFGTGMTAQSMATPGADIFDGPSCPKVGPYATPENRYAHMGQNIAQSNKNFGDSQFTSADFDDDDALDKMMMEKIMGSNTRSTGNYGMRNF